MSVRAVSSFSTVQSYPRVFFLDEGSKKSAILKIVLQKSQIPGKFGKERALKFESGSKKKEVLVRFEHHVLGYNS